MVPKDRQKYANDHRHFSRLELVLKLHKNCAEELLEAASGGWRLVAGHVRQMTPQQKSLALVVDMRRQSSRYIENLTAPTASAGPQKRPCIAPR